MSEPSANICAPNVRVTSRNWSENWAVEASCAAAFAPLARRDFPYVAYMHLDLPASNWAYIDELDYERDFKSNNQLTERLAGQHELEIKLGGKNTGRPSSIVAGAAFRKSASVFYRLRMCAMS